MTRKKVILLIVGCLVSVAAIWYTTREMNWADFAEAFARFKLWWLLPALALFYYSMYLRAVRWGLLFRPDYDLKGRRMWPPLMICFAFNSILPARVGEFVRAFYVGRREGTGVPMALATVATERIFDGVILLALLFVALLGTPIDPTVSMTWHGHTIDKELIEEGSRGLMTICLALVVGVILMLIPAVRRLMIGLVRGFPLLGGGVKEKLVGIVEGLARGFESVRDPRTLALILFHTVVLWILVGVSNLMVAYGMGIEMSLLQSMAVVTLIGIAILIPAAPGYWGLYELGVVFSLKVLGIEDNEERALAYGLIIHLVQYVPIVVIGLYYAARAHVKPSGEMA